MIRPKPGRKTTTIGEEHKKIKGTANKVYCGGGKTDDSTVMHERLCGSPGLECFDIKIELEKGK